MSLNVALFENVLTADPDDCIAVAQNVVFRTIPKVIAQITGPGSILKETECNAVVHAFLKQISTNLKEGEGFLSEYLIVSPGVRGVFKNSFDTFDRKRHFRQARIVPGSVMKEALEEMEVKIIDASTPQPMLREVYDFETETRNERLTPGGMIEIHGLNLKLSGGRSRGGYILY